MSKRLFPLALGLVAGLPLLVATWAILSPPAILSGEMTWDLLFNLAGAWHLWSGHVPHVDYHEPVGVLTFLLTEAGFALLGPSPRVVLVGMAIVAAVLFVIATLVAARRLTLLAAVPFVVFACLIVLRPANVGDHPDAYSFAMAYNRYGWSATAVLALLLFEAPQRRSAADIVEMAGAALLLAALFYLKMTYFAAGVAMLAVALVASPHVRGRWRGWPWSWRPRSRSSHCRSTARTSPTCSPPRGPASCATMRPSSSTASPRMPANMPSGPRPQGSPPGYGGAGGRRCASPSPPSSCRPWG